jgi:hypothetical protein
MALLGAVLVFSHKQEPKQPHDQASKRAPAQQHAPVAKQVTPTDEYSTPNAATNDDADNMTPGAILATKNALEAQKRHAKGAEEASKQNSAGTGSAQ